MKFMPFCPKRPWDESILGFRMKVPRRIVFIGKFHSSRASCLPLLNAWAQDSLHAEISNGNDVQVFRVVRCWFEHLVAELLISFLIVASPPTSTPFAFIRYPVCRNSLGPGKHKPKRRIGVSFGLIAPAQCCLSSKNLPRSLDL